MTLPDHRGTLAAVVSLTLAVTPARIADGQIAGSGAPNCSPSAVIPIAPAAVALPDEPASAAITRFSFIAYGDTRGLYDGRALQPDHEKVVEGILAAIKARANGPDAIRFVVQTGDAVTDGRIAEQWNASYNPLINRITVAAERAYVLST